ncbi:MAG: ABC transporter permease [Chitinophagales bacterium]
MGKFITRRLLLAIPTLLGVSLLVFLFLHLIPGDPAQALLGERASAESLAEVRHAMGLDQPIYVQYLRFMGQALHGDLGKSLISNMKVSEDLWSHFPATIELSLAAMLAAVLVGVPAGILAATRRNSPFDHGSMVVVLFGVSMPVFWLGLMLIWLFSLVLGWLPMSGRIDVAIDFTPVTNFYVLDALLARNWPALWNVLGHLVLPAVALGTIPMAIIARMTRSAMLEVLSQDYVRTAWSKGLAERVVVVRHALKNALIPVVTVVGLQFGMLLSGAVMTETIFAWPGIGKLTYEAIMNRDFPVLQGALLLVATAFVVINLLVDVVYAYLDPRIHYD